MIGALALSYDEYQRGRAQLEHDTLQTARALAQAVDSQLLRAQAIAQTLATSKRIAERNFADFHQQAATIIQQAGIGAYIAVHDENGRNIVNTLRPLGAPMPPHGNVEQVREVFRTGQSAISDLYIGSITRLPRISVYAPVVEGGKVAYVVNVGLNAADFGRILSTQRLPPDWVAVVFDRTGTIVARTRSPERFVGSKGVPEVIQHLRESREGFTESTSLEGIPLLTVYSRSPASNWSVTIGIPRQAIRAELVHALANLSFGVAILFAAGLALAWRMGGRIAGSMHALVEPALRLGRGERVEIPEVHMKEASEVASAIHTAAALLMKRTADLQKAYDALQENERLLEARVQERTAQLEAANRELEVFTFAASHDLRGPLRRIDSLSSLLETNYGDRLAGDGQRFLGVIRQEATRLGQLVTDLLSYTRVAQQDLELRELDALDLVQAVLQEKAEDIREAGAQVRLDLASAPVLADHRALAQALGNLVENALKYSAQSKPPIIEIGGHPRGDHFCLWVRDNGIGFDMAQHQKIFEMFRRLHSYNQFSGSGVGLALVKRAVERMGGKVWAESIPGQGASFFIELRSASSVRDSRISK